MKSKISLLLLAILILGACSSNSRSKTGDRLLEDPEHEIKDSPDISKHDSTVLYTGWYYLVDTENGFKRQLDKSTDTFFIDPKPIVTAKNFTALEIYESSAGGKNHFGLMMRLDETGTENWSVATE